MTTADAATAIGLAKAHLTKITDQATVLTGECAALPDTPVSAVESLSAAMDGHVEVVTTEALAANAQLDVALAALAGTPIPPDPPGPKPDLILERSNVTAPEQLPVGALLEALTITAIVRPPAAPDNKYRKLVGADGTKGKTGGLCLGLTAKGELEAWVDDGLGIRQAILSARAGKASFVSFRIVEGATGTKIDDATVAVTLPNGRVACDGIAAIGIGVYGHQFCDPMAGAAMPELRIYRVALTDAQIKADQDEWADLIDDNDVVVPPGPVDGDLEPVKPGVTQTTITVDSTPRQTWIGYGWGIGSPGSHEIPARLKLMQKWPHIFFDEMNSQAVRLIDPHNPEFISQNLEFVKWVRSKGVDTFIASGFYKSAHYSIESLADGIHAAVQAGIPITHCIPQNEPDGGPAGQPHPVTPDNELVPMFKAFRARLDSHGLQNVTILGQEWAHASGGDPNHEFDLLNAAGLIPSVVGYGAGHQYGDCADHAIGTDRWIKKGRGQISNESGYMWYNTASRVLAAMNSGGIVVEISHQAQSTSPSDTDLSQKLVTATGERRLAQQQMQIVSKAMLRGSVFRLCHSSDRPSGLDAMAADNMERRAGRNSRINVACAKRPDDRWVIIACVASDPSFGGTTTHQFTVHVTDLVGVDKLFGARKCTNSGAISNPPQVVMKNGTLRFTAAVNEVWSLVSNA